MMRIPGSRMMANGLIIVLFAASMSMITGGIFALLSFTGVLTGVSLIAIGSHMAGDQAEPLAVFARARAITAFLHCNLNIAGLLLASCAVSVVAGEEGRVLCFGMFGLLMLGTYLITTGIVGK